jgi:nicotinamidase-related amidase
VCLDPADSAIAVLDLSVRCDDENQACHELLEEVGGFLDRARAARVPIIFTASHRARGTPEGEVAAGLRRQDGEPVIYPDAFDKFHSGELREFLAARNVVNLVVVGSATNNAVMYTASSAARVHRYNVIIPIDGVNSGNPYEHEYALHQLSVLPRGSATPVQFTALSMVTFVPV